MRRLILALILGGSVLAGAVAPALADTTVNPPAPPVAGDKFPLPDTFGTGCFADNATAVIESNLNCIPFP